MKKLSLKQNAFDKCEALTRAQLKKVMGGDFSGTDIGGSDSPKIEACKAPKKDGDECLWEYNGNVYTGKCRSYMAQPLACSTLM